MLKVWPLPLIAVSSVMCLHTSCKSTQPAQSATYSLDNFVRGSGALTRNECSGNYNFADVDLASLPGEEKDYLEVDEEDENGPLHTSVKKALSSIPTGLLNTYFAAGNGINVSSDAYEACGIDPNQGPESLDDSGCNRSVTFVRDHEGKAIEANESQIKRIQSGESISRIFGIRQSSASGSSSQKVYVYEQVMIYVIPDVTAVEHALVRSFAYVLSDKLAKLKSQDDLLIVGQEDDPSFAEWKQDLKTSFETDYPNSADLYQNLALGEEELINAIFAESFDSYFCSEPSRKKMSNEFSKTFTLFDEDLAPSLEQLWSDEQEGDEVSEGLGLRGGFFRRGGQPRRPILRAVGVATRAVVRAPVAAVRGTVRAVGPRVVRVAQRIRIAGSRGLEMAVRAGGPVVELGVQTFRAGGRTSVVVAQRGTQFVRNTINPYRRPLRRRWR